MGRYVHSFTEFTELRMAIKANGRHSNHVPSVSLHVLTSLVLTVPLSLSTIRQLGVEKANLKKLCLANCAQIQHF